MFPPPKNFLPPPPARRLDGGVMIALKKLLARRLTAPMGSQRICRVMGYPEVIEELCGCSVVPWEGGTSQNPSEDPILVLTRFLYLQCERRRRKEKLCALWNLKCLIHHTCFSLSPSMGNSSPSKQNIIRAGPPKTIAESLLGA